MCAHFVERSSIVANNLIKSIETLFIKIFFALTFVQLGEFDFNVERAYKIKTK